MNGNLCRLRPYRTDDAAALAAVADDFEVARWMTQRFPIPYTLRDAEGWIAEVMADERTIMRVIEVNGKLAGGVGVDPLSGERRGTGVFGYWLGRAYWGRGIGSEAARLLSDFALQGGELHRLEATVFAPNVASAKVLANCGFALEGRAIGMYVDRDGVVCDGLIFGRTRLS